MYNRYIRGDNVKDIKWNFLIMALLATASISFIGIAIAEKSIFGAVISLIVLCGIMGYGFSQKKKLRNAQKIK